MTKSNDISGVARLTPRQEAFVREYLKDLNASAAAIRAGYKSGDIGRRLVTKSHVKALIDHGKRDRAERTNITVDLVVQETWKNYQRCVDAEEYGAANKALELLGRHTGAFPHKHEHSGPNGDPIPITFIEFAEQRPPADGTCPA
jgi:phage terminase small subunit